MGEVDQKKIYFRLERDADGYPPDDWEALWAFPTLEKTYQIDNIPFYARGISPGDVVRARTIEGLLTFESLVEPSDNSVFRIYVSKLEEVQSSRDVFRKLGCPSELSDVPRLFALEIPGNCAFDPVAEIIIAGV